MDSSITEIPEEQRRSIMAKLIAEAKEEESQQSPPQPQQVADEPAMSPEEVQELMELRQRKLHAIRGEEVPPVDESFLMHMREMNERERAQSQWQSRPFDIQKALLSAAAGLVTAVVAFFLL